jgi:RNA polymerase sigma factor (sigma-70 family)
MQEIDEITVKQAVKKDHAAFKRLYDHYAPFVWKVIYRTVNGEEDTAAEVVQLTFIRVYNSLHSFSRGSALSTWIYRIAYNAALSLLAKTKRLAGSVPIDDQLPGPDGHSRFEAKEMLDKMLQTISEDDRFLLTAHEATGLSFDDLAQVTGSTEGALRVKLHRLKMDLRERFGSLAG